jgi:aryl-alcohol dehydrogenase
MYCDDFMRLNIGMCRTDGSATIFDGDKPVAASLFGQSSFATLALANARNAIKVPGDVPLEILGPLGCGIQAGAGTVMNALKPRCGSSIAVFGSGPVGLSAILAAKVAGCATIIAVDIKENRLQLATELGATHVINGGEADAVRGIRKITGGRGANHSIDSTAVPSVIRQAVDCLAMPGSCAIVGLAPFGTEVSLDVNTLLNGRTVRGVTEGDSVPAEFIPALIELWRQGQFPFDRMIRTYPFHDINAAVADTESGSTLKAVLLMP